MDDSVPVWVTALLSALTLGVGGLVPYVTAQAARGGLRRNAWVGIRTPGTLSSDAAWRAGHAGALPWAVASGVVFALTGVAVLALGAGGGGAAVFAGVLVGGVLAATVVLLVGAVRAEAAARRA